MFFIGSCGGINDVDVGEIILPAKAYAGEGFSQYFLNNSKNELIFEDNMFSHPANELLRMAKNSLENSNSSFKLAKIFTTGSLFSETEAFIKTLKDGSFNGIDMEVSAFYTAANVAELKAVALLYATDIPFAKPFDGDFSHEEIRKMRVSRDKIIETAVNLSKQLA